MTKLKMLKLDTGIKLILGLLISILIFWLLFSCSTLQKEPGFKNYPKNTSWKIEKEALKLGLFFV